MNLISSDSIGETFQLNEASKTTAAAAAAAASITTIHHNYMNDIIIFANDGVA